MTTRAERIATATAPIVIDGQARARFAQAARPSRDDYGIFATNGIPYVVRRWGSGTTFWWVIAEPGEAATQGAILVAESATGETAPVPVPRTWVNRWAVEVARTTPVPVTAAA